MAAISIANQFEERMKGVAKTSVTFSFWPVFNCVKHSVATYTADSMYSNIVVTLIEQSGVIAVYCMPENFSR